MGDDSAAQRRPRRLESGGQMSSSTNWPQSTATQCFGRRRRNSSSEGADGRGETICCQLQACNVLLAILGAIGLGLAGTQFQPRIGIDNYRQIDLRLAVSLLHTITGTVGFYCVGRSHGSIVIKCLYILSILFALGSAIFYGFTTFKLVDLHHQLVRFEHQGGQFTGAYGVVRTSADFMPKIVISSAMSALCLLTLLVALLALALLDRLVVVERPWYPAQREDQIRAKFSRTLLMGAALAKLLTGMASLGLAFFVEFQHSQLALRQDYFRIILDQMSAWLAIGSAMADIYAVYNKLHNSLNLKVSIGLSTVAAVWCLKSVDNNAFPFYKQDIQAYRVALSATQSAFASVSTPQYAIVIVHGILLALLSLLALLCACTAILAASCLRECIAKREEEIVELKMQNRFLALLHSFWTICLLCLLVLGLSNLPWNGDFIGGDLLWLAVVVFGAGLLHSSNRRNLTLIKFVLNAICLAFCAEKALLSIWLIFQSATHPDYTNEAVFDRRSRIGQIVLHSTQFFVLAAESVTAFCGTVIYAKAIRARRNIGGEGSNNSMGLHCCCAFSALFYALTLVGSEVFFELDKWFWSEAVLESTQFYRLGNGLLGLVVFIIQLVCCANPQFLVPSTLLQLILSSLALFTLNSAITNTYYLQILYNARFLIGINSRQNTILIAAICFAGASALACTFQLICGTITILRSSFLLHHSRPRSSVAISPDALTSISYCAASPVDDNQSWYRAVLGTVGSQPSPSLHQIAIQPIEEQTLYWSADDNPYIYKSTKRIFGQPILGVETQTNSAGLYDESGYGGSPSPIAPTRYAQIQQQQRGSGGLSRQPHNLHLDPEGNAQSNAHLRRAAFR